MKKLIFSLIFSLIASLTCLALKFYDFNNVKYYQPGETYCGVIENSPACFIGVGVHPSGANCLSVAFVKDNNNAFYFSADEGDSKIEEAHQTFTFNGFDLSDAKIISDIKSSKRIVIARIGKNVFIGEYNPSSRTFNKAAIVDSGYAPQVDKAINDAISQGILISYLKAAEAPQETKPVKPRQPAPRRPSTGSTPRTK